MEALEAVLRELWLAVATHLWQTSLVWAALFATWPFFRSAPGRHQELLWGTALAKLFVPLALLAPWSRPLAALLLGGAARRSLDGALAATVSVLADPLARMSGATNTSLPGIWTALTLLWLVGAAAVLLGIRFRGGRSPRPLPLAEAASRVRSNIESALATTDIPSEAIRVAEGGSMPAVEGVFRPRIVLSERAALALSSAELRAILLHEDAHRRRLDPLRGLVQRCALAVFFYYPPLWWVLRGLRSAAEFRCDERAAARCGTPRTYIEALARTVALELRPARGFAAGGSRSLLKERFTRIHEPWRYVAMPRHRIVLALSTALLALLSVLLLAVSSSALAGGSASLLAALPEPAGVMKIDERVTAPRLVEKVEPVYPREAQLARQQGRVILQCTIDVDGSVRALEVLRGIPEAPSLEKAALDAVRQWRYEPALFEGKPVAVYFTVLVSFSLDADASSPAQVREAGGPI